MHVWADLKYYKLNTIIIVFLMVLGLTSFMSVASFVETVGNNCDEFIFGTFTGDYVISKNLDSSELLISDEQLLKISNLEGVESVTRRIVAPAILESETANSNIMLIGVEEVGSESLLNNFGISENILFSDDSVIAVNKSVADGSGFEQGNELNVKYLGNSISAKVVAITEPTYTNTIINTWCVTDYDLALKLLDKKVGYSTSVMIYTTVENDAMLDEIQSIIGDDGKTEYWKNTPAGNLMIAPTIWKIVLYSMMVSLFMLICIGCSALIMSSLNNRIRDIGILKTLGVGASKLMLYYLAEVMLMFLLSIILSVIACTVGVYMLNEYCITSDSMAFLFVIGSKCLRMALSWKVFVIPSVICAVCCISVISFPIRKITRNRIMDIIYERE